MNNAARGLVFGVFLLGTLLMGFIATQYSGSDRDRRAAKAVGPAGRAP